MNVRILGMTLVAVIAAIGVAGCGGSDDSSSTSTAAALSQDEFLSQGNAICAAGNKVLDDASKAAFSSGKPTAAEGETFVNDTLVPSVQGQIDDIGALQPPAELADQVTAFLDQAQSALDTVKADPTVALSGDAFAEVNKTAVDIGLDTCAG